MAMRTSLFTIGLSAACCLGLSACGGTASATSSSAYTEPPLPSPLPPARNGLPDAPSAQIITGYLDSVQQGDCATAELYTTPGLFLNNGDLCVGNEPGPIKFDQWRSAQWRSSSKAQPAHPSADVYIYTVEIHVTEFQAAAGGIGSKGWATWFLEVRKGTAGYRLVSGGSGP